MCLMDIHRRKKAENFVVRPTSNLFVKDKRGCKELPTLTFSAFFHVIVFLFSSLIFELIKYIKNCESQKNIRSYNAVFETTSNH